MKDLWVVKHAPKNLGEIAGQKKASEAAALFVRDFTGGKALLLAGPSGSGKSAIAECAAREFGMAVLRLDADEERGKSAIEAISQTAKTLDIFGRRKLILIEDVDGLGAGDRGGAGAIAALIKGSAHPVILTASDPYIQKLRPLREVSKIVKLTRVPSPSIEKKLREICKSEGIEPDGNVLSNLARWSNGDMRSAINDLEMAAKGKTSIEDKDLEMLGFRERSVTIFDCMNSVFKSGSMRAAKNAADNSDTDPDDIFLWAASNLYLEYSGRDLGKAYRLIREADIMRGRVIRQQNYRFRLYMLEIACGLSSVMGARNRYVGYQPPKRFQMWGAGAERETVAKALGHLAHCSAKKAKGAYMAYLSIIYGGGLSKLTEENNKD